MSPWAVLAAGCLALAVPLLRPGCLVGAVDLPAAAGPGPGPGAARPARRRLAVALAGSGALVVLGVALAPAASLPPTAPPVAAVLAAGSAGVAWLVVRRRGRRAAVARAGRVLEACELLAAELAAGLPAGRALGRAADAEPLLGPAASAEALGADVVDALRRSAETPGAAGLSRLAAAWSVSQRTGQRLAPAVRSVGAALRRDRATRRVVDTELASARATARLLAALPVLALVLGGGTGSDAWAFLLGTPAGVACLALGVGLGMAGLVWIERITDAAETT